MSSAPAKVKSQNPSSDNIRNMEHKIRIIYRLESGGGGTISEDCNEKATSIFKQENTDREKAINQLLSHGEDVVSGVAAGLLIEKNHSFIKIEKVVFEGKDHVVYEISFPNERHNDFVKLVSTEDFTSKLLSAGIEADKHIQEKVGSTGVHEDIVGILKRFSIMLVDPFTCKTEIPPMNCNYNMDSSKRGKLVIFNQVDFSVDPKITRKGADKDNESLVDTFEQLGFEVTSFRNLKKKELEDKITEISNQDYSKFNCFACAIMTHGGDNGALWASDDKFDLETVVDPFRSQASLIGKPKLFFIQACRGDLGDPGAKKDSDPMPTDFTIPIEADSLISYSSTDGYVSYRSPEEGSWYIQTLTECLQQHKNLEITHILTLVSRKVCMKTTVPATEHEKEKHQVPCFESGLTGFLYFSGENNYPKPEITEPRPPKTLEELKTEYDEKKLEIQKRRKIDKKTIEEMKKNIVRIKPSL